MNRFNIFVIRVILGAVFAVLLMRIFHPGLPLMYVIALAVALVSLAYLMEYWRKRKNKP